MAKRVKITKKELPILKTDLDLDVQVVERLSKLQGEFNTQFRDRISEARKETLETYTKKLEALQEAKAAAVKRYDTEIAKYKELISALKKEVKPPVRKQPGAKTNPKKPTRKKTSTAKKK